MDRNKLNTLLSAVLTTLAEVPQQSSPCGVLYAALMGEVDLGGWEFLQRILTEAGLVTVSAHEMTLTTKGADMAAQINAALAAVRK